MFRHRNVMHAMGELLAVQKTDQASARPKQASARLGVAAQVISGILPRRATTPGARPGAVFRQVISGTGH